MSPRQVTRGGGFFVTGDPRPTGLLRLSRPTIFWRLYPDISDPALSLDGRPVEVRYDDALRAIVYRPAAALAAETHRVVASVTVAGRQRVTREWEFAIAPGAPAEMPSVLYPDEAALFDAANLRRKKSGLAPFSFDPGLRAAAVSHAEYLRRNRVGGHFQELGQHGFTGRTPMERARSFGYVEDIAAEDVALEETDGPGNGAAEGARAIANLFDAPYHRLPFLDPRLTLLGVGAAVGRRGAVRSACATIVFGGRQDGESQPVTIVSPGDGEDNVPTNWVSRETPDPLRFFGAIRDAIGYPIVFARSGTSKGKPGRILRLADFRLVEETGRAVACWIVSPERDAELRGEAALLLPNKSLRPRTRYRVSVRAYDPDGRDISRTWSFRTH